MTATPTRREAALGIAKIEGYLLWQAELSNARTEGASFAAGLTWLTEEQRADIAERYAEERVRLARRVLTGVAERCAALEAEYGERYRRLRVRLLAVALCTLLGCATLAVVALAVAAEGV
ncbi:hypothetical protein [Streptomyces radicis]|uniref:Cytochrome C oxidase subunit I n=1 Tax=Streptomyces radicis TaxID=1750517 RepID=A0A3A9WDG3_9ACTN|nr:hypothetical protein [Streptomyces radicis]RKN05696.1 hypothetical protein D7319_24520 [Streptomyces radicis]RKN17536.1 hypothetical protein D7318_23885 [Streptomyces radicis]